MKKIFLSILIALSVTTSMVGCDKTVKNTVKKENQTQQTESNNEVFNTQHMKFNEMGLEYDIPKDWAEKTGISIFHHC